jgi:ATP-dependent protease HslVU (ClpYQ) peptidase subunit
MTCIVGIKEDGIVYIGGDSAGVGGLSLTVRADPKVFIKGEFIMGFTSSFRMGELLQYKLPIPLRPQEVDIYEYMVTSFVDAVRDCLKNGGYARKDKEAEEAGTFLVGYRGRLFCIESDYQVRESTFPYDAVGCGADIALGAMFSTEGMPENRILNALEAAEQFSAGVRRPFKVLKI